MHTPKPSLTKAGSKQKSSAPGAEAGGDTPRLPPIASRLLAWYDRNGRDLPWRNTADPYRIWLSEIMLQQTGVKTVLPYYQRFLEHYPTISELAAAPVEEVIALWAGLGYYSRARNLHRTARLVTEEHRGVFPDDPEQILELPGIGRSTAGAILAIAFNRRTPILDGNVRRVLCRLLALQENPRRPAVERRLWAWAEAQTPAERPGDYAQAIMDLGASLCTPNRPACMRCPLEDLCGARRTGLENQIPGRQRKNPVPTVVELGVLLSRNGRILVRRRPLEGLLGGLWEFPTIRVLDERDLESAGRTLLERLGLDGILTPAARVKHAYSHFRLTLHLFAGEVENTLPSPAAETGVWLASRELAALPLHGAHKKALSLVLKHG